MAEQSNRFMAANVRKGPRLAYGCRRIGEPAGIGGPRGQDHHRPRSCRFPLIRAISACSHRFRRADTPPAYVGLDHLSSFFDDRRSRAEQALPGHQLTVRSAD
jgi:hypothetical protein